MHEEDLLNKLLESQINIQNYLKFLIIDKVFNIHTDIFKDKRQLWVYDLADGNLGLREMGESIGVNKDIVNNWFKEFEKIGIVERIGKKRVYKKKYSIIELSYLDIKMGEKQDKS